MQEQNRIFNSEQTTIFIYLEDFSIAFLRATSPLLKAVYVNFRSHLLKIFCLQCCFSVALLKNFLPISILQTENLFEKPKTYLP